MKCIDCARLGLKAYPKHAVLGMGQCALDKLPGVFVSIAKDRQCDKFQEAAQGIAQKRREWWLSIKGK
jgi:hypothetical protein